MNCHKSLQPYCVFISKIALKQVFLAYGRSLPNHCFVGKRIPFFKRKTSALLKIVKMPQQP